MAFKGSGKKKNGRGTASINTQIEARQARVGELYSKGWSLQKIADELKVSRATAGFDLKALRAAWAESAMWDMTTAIGLQLAKVDEVERAAWDAYEISRKGPPRRKKDEDGNVLDEFEPMENLPALFPGDAEYLEIVRKCVLDRCKIMGIGKEDGAKSTTNNIVVGPDFWDRVAGPSRTQLVEDVIAAEEAKALPEHKKQEPRVVTGE